MNEKTNKQQFTSKIQNRPSGDVGDEIPASSEDLEYFESDPNNIQDFDYDISTHLEYIHDPYFKFGAFLRYLLSHLLFFFVLGPSIIILTPCFGFMDLKNQGFVGCTSNLFSQTLTAAVIVVTLLSYYLITDPYFYFIEVYMIIIATVVRCITISSKYGYVSNRYLKCMQQMLISPEDTQSEVMLADWRLQTEYLVNFEIQASILRLELDTSTFYFHFISKSNDQNLSKLLKRQTLREGLRRITTKFSSENILTDTGNGTERSELVFVKENSLKKSKLLPIQSRFLADSLAYFSRKFNKLGIKCEDSFYGYNLALDLINNANKQRNQHLGKQVFMFSLLRAFIPTLYRVWNQQPPFSDHPYVIILPIIINTLFFWLNSFIFTILNQDMQVKIFCLKQLGNLISPKKIYEFQQRKIYPTLNVFDPMTLKTWNNIRKIIFQYGGRFIKRNSLNLSIVFTFYGLILLILIIEALGIVKIYSDPLLLIILSYETIFYLLLFIQLLLGAAFINSQFSIHRNLLYKVKMLVSDINNLSSVYLGEDRVVPQDILHAEALKILTKNNEDSKEQEKELSENSEKVNKVIEDIIGELEFEETHNPLCVLGIAIDYKIVGKFLLAIASVAFAVIQIKLSSSVK